MPGEWIDSELASPPARLSQTAPCVPGTIAPSSRGNLHVFLLEPGNNYLAGPQFRVVRFERGDGLHRAQAKGVVLTMVGGAWPQVPIRIRADFLLL